MELEAADLMMIDCGPAANAAKYLAAEVGFKACQTAIAAHCGYGYAKEYHVERYLREIMIAKLAPISPQLILCFNAEKVLGLPMSY
jgi:acyl-CoA dehydrogenase